MPLRVAVHNDPISLDPQGQNEVLTYSILANLFDALTTFDAEMHVGPNLAAGWENPDERTWVFNLRADARFHDGRPVEADDVVFSLERARRPRSNMAAFLVEVETIRALGPRTVRVTTRRPFACLLNKLAFVFVVPRGAPDVITSPVGSGAYRFVAFDRGRFLKLEPFPGDWRADPARLPLEFVPVRDPEERARRLLAGQVDVVQDMSSSDVARVQSSPACRVVTRSGSVVEYLHLMYGDPRFADRRVREAIHVGLDRRRLVKMMVDDYGEPAGQMAPPGVFGYDPTIEVPERDLARARRLLAEAGQHDGLPVALELRVGRQGEEIARQLEEIGLHVTLAVSPWPEMYERLKQRRVPFYYGGVAAPSADASDIFDSFVHTRVEPQGYGSSNFNAYTNPDLDAVIEASATTLNLLSRRALLQRSMRLLMQDLYVVPLIVRTDLYGMRREVAWQPRLDRLLLGREMRRVGR